MLGSVYLDEGFSSTSTDRNVARTFATAQGGPNSGAILKIITPPGSKVISFSSLNNKDIVEEEKEILCNRNGVFGVSEINTKKTPMEITVEYFGEYDGE